MAYVHLKSSIHEPGGPTHLILSLPDHHKAFRRAALLASIFTEFIAWLRDFKVCTLLIKILFYVSMLTGREITVWCALNTIVNFAFNFCLRLYCG